MPNVPYLGRDSDAIRIQIGAAEMGGGGLKGGRQGGILLSYQTPSGSATATRTVKATSTIRFHPSVLLLKREVSNDLGLDAVPAQQ
jgi:hypothetical protein